jgi:hypothetical protein
MAGNTRSVTARVARVRLCFVRPLPCQVGLSRHLTTSCRYVVCCVMCCGAGGCESRLQRCQYQRMTRRGPRSDSSQGTASRRRRTTVSQRSPHCCPTGQSSATRSSRCPRVFTRKCSSFTKSASVFHVAQSRCVLSTKTKSPHWTRRSHCLYNTVVAATRTDLSFLPVLFWSWSPAYFVVSLFLV